jgi:hypothetical protein
VCHLIVKILLTFSHTFAAIVTIFVANVETYGTGHFRDTFDAEHTDKAIDVNNQAVMQLAALGVTLAMAICGGGLKSVRIDGLFDLQVCSPVW